MQRTTKKTTLMLGLTSLLSISLVSCSQESHDENLPESQQGCLFLNLKSETGFSNTTRALNENSYANTDNYQIVVTDKNNSVKLNCKGNNSHKRSCDNNTEKRNHNIGNSLDHSLCICQGTVTADNQR